MDKETFIVPIKFLDAAQLIRCKIIQDNAAVEGQLKTVVDEKTVEYELTVKFKWTLKCIP